MKTIPPTCPEPESGRKYWRSLDDLAETPEFRQWVEREFPAEASEWADPVSRRHFVKIMSASFLLGGFGLAGSGCRRPEQKILPFGKMPENYVHGVPQYFATAMPTRGGAIPLDDERSGMVAGHVSRKRRFSICTILTEPQLLSMSKPSRILMQCLMRWVSFQKQRRETAVRG